MTTTVRRALVTGATSGIGRAIAEALAAQGAHVVVTGRDRQRGEEVVAAIRATRGKADFIVADVASAESVAQLAAAAEKLLGGVDILVNNAGIFTFGPSADVTEAGFDTMYDLSLIHI